MSVPEIFYWCSGDILLVSWRYFVSPADILLVSWKFLMGVLYIFDWFPLDI